MPRRAEMTRSAALASVRPPYCLFLALMRREISKRFRYADSKRRARGAYAGSLCRAQKCSVRGQNKVENAQAKRASIRFSALNEAGTARSAFTELGGTASKRAAIRHAGFWSADVRVYLRQVRIDGQGNKRKASGGGREGESPAACNHHAVQAVRHQKDCPLVSAITRFRCSTIASICSGSCCGLSVRALKSFAIFSSKCSGKIFARSFAIAVILFSPGCSNRSGQK